MTAIQIITRLGEYVHASDDIPTWDVEEIDGLLEQLLVELHPLEAESARDKAVIDLAREQWVGSIADEGNLRIDDDALVSDGDENGAYVEAWVWTAFAGTALDKGDEALDPSLDDHGAPDSDAFGYD